MDGKEAIIKKIIDDATEKGDSIIKSAEDSVAKMIADAESWADEYKKAENAVLDREIKAISDRDTISANLDIKKIVLSKKQDFLNEIFEKVNGKLCKLDKPKYLAFVKKLINENCDEEDAVMLSCDGVLSESDFSGDKTFKDKKLSFVKEKGDFIGGVKLIGKISDKDLTFKSVVNGLKDVYSPKISAEIFK